MKKFKKYAALFVVGVALCLTGCGEDTAKDNAGSNIAEEVDNTEADNTETDNTEADNTETDNTEADNTEADNTEADNTEVDNTEVDNTEAHDTEVEGTVIENDHFKFTVDKEWRQIPIEIMPGTVSVGKNNNESINVIKMPEMPELTGLTVEEYQTMVQTNLASQPGCEIISSEIKDTNLGKIIYIEAKTTITEELVQQSIDAGVIKQEVIDAAGGIKLYANGMSLNQVAVYYLDEDKAITFTGQTANGVDLADTKEQLDKIISNIEIK